MNYRALIIAGTLLAMSGGAEGAEVHGLRLWAGPDKTRAVIDLGGSVDYRVFSLQNPDRVVVDLDASHARDALPVPELAGQLVSGIRTGRRNSGDLRIVFDLKSATRPKSFLLPPVDQYGHRLVVDLYPTDDKPDGPVKQILDVVSGEREIVVALDAGHGGEDPGAIGPSGLQEKEVALAVAQQVKTLIDALPGMRGELVREGDYYIAHQDRPARARELRADLFVSIHADAFYDRKVRGSGVFVLSTGRASSEAARWLADRENRADLVGGVKLDDKDDTLAAVLLDLSQSASMEASTRAAAKVLAALAAVGATHKPYVEKANLAVLTAPDIPSMLVETAFISNPDEEKRLRSRQGRAQIARAIADGIVAYFESHPPPGTQLATRGPINRHTVSRGETLSEIAQRHRISLSQLRAANNLNGDMVKVGEVLRIPAS